MVDVLDAYLMSINTVLSVGYATNSLGLVETPTKPVAYVRLKKQVFELSEDIEYYTKVVTAHKLSQYKNKIHNVTLEEDITTWLDILMADDVAARERIMKE